MVIRQGDGFLQAWVQLNGMKPCRIQDFLGKHRMEISDHFLFVPGFDVFEDGWWVLDHRGHFFQVAVHVDSLLNIFCYHRKYGNKIQAFPIKVKQAFESPKFQ
jgi:hypothetical protein